MKTQTTSPAPATDRTFRPAETFPEPTVRGEGLLRLGERAFLALDRLVARLIPRESWNPFARTGAIAMTTFLVASVTGVLLLLWYRASVNSAYDSVAAMGAQPFPAGLVRALHRYSSDACLFFATIHVLQVLFQRRFTGARWLAWVTGFLLMFMLWVVGWLGYWLIWDEQGQMVATASAEMLDVLPVFVDPLSRSFLVDEQVNSLLFFMVFFVHMLLPLGMGVLLWLHLVRVSRPRFLTDRMLTIWVLGSLLAVSLLLPPDLPGPARMGREPDSFTMDAWYLMPLTVAQRMSVGASWAVLIVVGMVGISVPWSLSKRGQRRAPPAVDVPERCTACENCFHDCPYGAISMVPRTAGEMTIATQAQVDPARCVGCGICNASCDTMGVGLPELPVSDARAQVRQWGEAARAAGREEWLLVGCGTSAAAGLEVRATDGSCAALPGWRVMPAPCAGWLHATVAEMALRRGLQGVAVVACGPGECHFREGVRATEERITGARAPAVDGERSDPRRIEVLRLDRTRGKDLPRELAAFQSRVRALDGAGATHGAAANGAAPSRRRIPRPVSLLGGVALAAVLTGVTWAGSSLTWHSAIPDTPRLFLSFKHPGQFVEESPEISAEELANRPVHMRPVQSMARHRAPVRVRVDVDGVTVLERSYPPRGLWGDGNSIAVEPIEVAEGKHRVEVFLADGPPPAAGAPEEWTHRADAELDFAPRDRRVVEFGREHGFRFH